MSGEAPESSQGNGRSGIWCGGKRSKRLAPLEGGFLLWPACDASAKIYPMPAQMPALEFPPFAGRGSGRVSSRKG